ncbi:MAG: O-antigen ligase family protein [Candidatus Kerfeldbacteria bacterium]|nr:O-antigen ligase family protein [Candidatus Kerfeldbacteria bacterium]
MLQKLFARTFELTFAGLIIAALLSLASFFTPVAHLFIFFAIIAAVLGLGVWRFEVAFYILLAELFAGSQGRSFSAVLGGFSFSLRMGLFAVLLLLWLVFRARFDIRRAFRTPIGWWLLVLVLVICLGIVLGLAGGNNTKFLYLDVNGMLYALGAVFFFSAIRSRDHIQNVLQILAASLAFSALFALVLFLFFSHGSQFVPEVYRWVRDTRMFEITGLGGRYYRIFSQTHIFAPIGALLFASLYATALKKQDRRRALLMMFLSVFLLVVSFSRSFLAAALMSLVVLLMALAKIFHWPTRKIIGFLVGVVIVIALNVGLLFGLAALIGKTSLTVSLSALEERTTDVSQPGVASRYGLFLPLLKASLHQPILGSGWGTTITYQTADPRIIASSGGLYTTFAFEWGYLDLLLKIGLLGLLVSIGIFTAFLVELRQLLRQSTHDSGLVVGFGLGIIALFLTHAFTPYLNHPTGIGFLLLVAAIFLVLRQRVHTIPPA